MSFKPFFKAFKKVSAAYAYFVVLAGTAVKFFTVYSAFEIKNYPIAVFGFVFFIAALFKNADISE